MVTNNISEQSIWVEKITKMERGGKKIDSTDEPRQPIKELAKDAANNYLA
jgi:hypothetical protein